MLFRSLTATVGDNGAFYGAGLLDPTDRWTRTQSLESLTDTLNSCNAPKNEQACRDAAAVFAAAKQARDERAAAAEAAYTAADTYERRRCQRIAEQIVDMTMDDRYSLTDQAEKIQQTMYEKRFCAQVLQIEGKYNDDTKRCYTFAEAAQRVLMNAVGSLDATRPATAVAHAKAVQTLLNLTY